MAVCRAHECFRSNRTGTAVAIVVILVAAFVFGQSPLDKALEEYKMGNFHGAFDLWNRLAKDGDVRALDNLGIMFHEGQGVPQNFAEALSLFHRAALKGLPDAQLHLARMYDFGEGVASDLSESVRWYRMAAEHGNVQAQRNLGIMYQQGQGLPVNLATALHWLTLAANQGDSEAAARIGGIYFIWLVATEYSAMMPKACVGYVLLQIVETPLHRGYSERLTRKAT